MDSPLIKTLLARQGIYDTNGSVFGYELLYRSDDSLKSNLDSLDFLAGEIATSSVISQLFTNLDMNAIIGEKRAFINFTRNHLMDEVPSLLPKHQIVIEVLETVKIDQPLITYLTKLHKLDYKIALDDFVYCEEIVPLIELAHIIKIDVLNQNKKGIAAQMAPLKNFKGKLLAEKIETKEQFNICVDLGFEYFQGFFLNKPDPFKGPVISENKIHLLRLLAELNNEDVSMTWIEQLILQIPKLSYRILRLANSASFYNGKKIESLMSAMTQLGLVQIRNWISVLLLASVDDVSPDLLERTLIRAKMCECLSETMGYNNHHQAYTVGILSTLDSILNESMSSLLSKIQLSDLLNDALIDKKGELGQILQYTLNYEQANFNELDKAPIANHHFVKSYLQGLDHAQKVLSLVNK